MYLTSIARTAALEVRDRFARHGLPQLGERSLESLRRADITDTIDAIVTGGKKGRTPNRRTANMTLALLRQFVRWCAVREWIDRDPTLGISKKDASGRAETRERNLSDLAIIEQRDKLAGAKLPERTREAL